MSNLKISAITGSLGKLGDRFCLDGYKKDISFEEKLKGLSSIKDLKAVELCYETQGDESDAEEVRSLLEKYNFKASAVNAPLSNKATWKFGTFSAKNEDVRKKAIDITKKTIDFADNVGSDLVNLWLGQDGFDYCFQTNYIKQWDMMIEGIRECADYNKNINIALEFKPREPRNRCLLDSATTTLLLVKDIKRDNVGITIDVGHVLQAKQNMAQSVEIVAKNGKLFNLHMNDNYGDWDDDMIFGSTHLMENLELFFSLRKVKYDKWCSVDIFPFREDSIKATEESILYMEKFDDLIDKIGYEELLECTENDDAIRVLRLVREKIFK